MLEPTFFPPSGQKFANFFTQLTPATPLVVLLVLIVLRQLGFDYILRKILKCVCHVNFTDFKKLKDVCMDENLDCILNYFTRRQRDSWIKEEVVCVKRNALVRLNQTSFTELVESKQQWEKKNFNGD